MVSRTESGSGSVTPAHVAANSVAAHVRRAAAAAVTGAAALGLVACGEHDVAPSVPAGAFYPRVTSCRGANNFDTLNPTDARSGQPVLALRDGYYGDGKGFGALGWRFYRVGGAELAPTAGAGNSFAVGSDAPSVDVRVNLWPATALPHFTPGPVRLAVEGMETRAGVATSATFDRMAITVAPHGACDDSQRHLSLPPRVSASAAARLENGTARHHVIERLSPAEIALTTLSPRANHGGFVRVPWDQTVLDMRIENEASVDGAEWWTRAFFAVNGTPYRVTLYRLTPEQVVVALSQVELGTFRPAPRP